MRLLVYFFKFLVWNLLYCSVTVTCQHGTKDCLIFSLVHGTWAQDAEWHQLDGDFYSSFKNSARQNSGNKKEVFVITFNWSGNFSHNARLKAGKELADYIEGFCPRTEFHIMAHSHGANIVFIASQILAERGSGHRIEACYTMGAPINTRFYDPEMRIIRHLYNFFSFNDIIQPILGLYSRVLPSHERIVNLRVVLDGVEPGHYDLRSATLGHWLPLFHKLCHVKAESFSRFAFNQPGLIHFFKDRPPLYSLDYNRSELDRKDKQIQKRLLMYSIATQKSRYFAKRKTEPSIFNVLLESAEVVMKLLKIEKMSKDKQKGENFVSNITG